MSRVNTTTTYSSRTADKFVVRLPDGMRTRIEMVAKDNHRSMNSEIIARLEHTLDDDGVNAAFTPKTPVEPWTPVIGMIVTFREGNRVGSPLKIVDFHFDDDVLMARLYGNERSETWSVADLKPYLVK